MVSAYLEQSLCYKRLLFFLKVLHINSTESPHAYKNLFLPFLFGVWYCKYFHPFSSISLLHGSSFVVLFSEVQPDY